MYNVHSTREGFSRYFSPIMTDNSGDLYAIERAYSPQLMDSAASGVAFVQAVVFERWSNDAAVREEVHVSWQNAFRWADHDKSGGNVIAVIVGDDSARSGWRQVRAKSLWFNVDHPSVPIGSDGKPKHTLYAISVEEIGDIMRRDYDVSREMEIRRQEAARLNTTVSDLPQATVRRPADDPQSHLNALELRLSHEREYLRNAKTGIERELRGIWITQIEKEIAAERKSLGLSTELPDIGNDELAEELRCDGDRSGAGL